VFVGFAHIALISIPKRPSSYSGWLSDPLGASGLALVANKSFPAIKRVENGVPANHSLLCPASSDFSLQR
jgi:hypothetical protein